ncbi:hypothetical protein NIES4106_62120 (plasmid) [Fischerella sp. NIES-4106]|nr:hypothetical protein NIES4106_62120 [Fischerella sp. NIES-4106]
MKNSKKPLDKAIVAQPASKRNTTGTKKQCQVSRLERFRLALTKKELTICLEILESAGFTGDAAIFMIGYFQQKEVAA